MFRFCDRPCGPQSSPWSLASVTSEILALLSAVMAVAGASKMYGLDCGSGHVPSVTAVSRLTIVRFEPASSGGAVSPNAVPGFWARRPPTSPAKCTSPPKPMVTGLLFPFQSGLSGECLGNGSAATVSLVATGGGGGGGLPRPPEKKAKWISNRRTGVPPTANCRRRRRTLRDTTAALCHTPRPAQWSCASCSGGPEVVPVLGQGRHEALAGGGDHVAAFVEDRVVAVVGVGHVGGCSGSRVEGPQEGEPPGLGAQAAQRLLVPAVQCHHEVDPPDVRRTELARHVAVAGVAGPDERGRGQRVHGLAFVPGAGARPPDVGG